jgi:hypothetical protein
MLLPLALWAVERRRTWVAAAALASIPLSGQVHLALGAIPFFAAYAWVRRAGGRMALAPAAAVAAGVLVYVTSIRGTTGASGRSFGQVERYSAELLDLVTRHSRHGFESFVFLGWITPIVAVGGLALLAAGRLVTLSSKRDRALAAVLGAGVAVPILLALGANTPLYEPLWEAIPGLGHTRVPGRLLPIAALCLAAGAAVAIGACISELQARRRPGAGVAAALAVLVVAVDLRVDTYDRLVADEDNAVYASIPDDGAGLLETPVQPPDRQENSVYLYYAMQAPHPRPLGYSTTAPPEAQRFAQAFVNPVPEEVNALVRDAGVRHLVGFENGRPERYVPFSGARAPR